MVRTTERFTPIDHDIPTDLQETLARYSQSRRSLALLLSRIDDEVEQLVRRHKLRSFGHGQIPALRIDLDVCPGPLEAGGPANFGPARPRSGPPRWKSNKVDETLIMSQVFGNGSTDVDFDLKPATDGVEVAPQPRADDGQEATGLLSGGAVLGSRYELIKCVGTGGSSAVYKALDRRRMTFDDVSPFVAVKILKARFSSRADWRASIQREAITSQRLAHPNIIRVYDTFEEGATICLIMEYLTGAPLTDRIRSDKAVRLPKELALKIVDSMGRALAYAHRRGIVHCDFKPANIFITQEGTVKLIDFGVAQSLPEPAPGPTAAESGEADILHPVTPAYASPEHMDRQAPDPRDDVYSLACTAYELLTGTHPFDFKSAIEARRLNLTVQKRNGITRQQWKALVHALDLQRATRTPTIARFLSEFFGWTWQAQILSKAAGAKVVSHGLAWLGTRPRAAVVAPLLPEPVAGTPTLSDGTAALPLPDAAGTDRPKPNNSPGES